MALNYSHRITEQGNDSPHGEMYRCVYNQSHAVDNPIPIGGVPAWTFVALLWDEQPFGGTFPPAAPVGAEAAAELFGGYWWAGVAAPGFPAGAHQNNLGAVTYTAGGVGLMGGAALDTLQGMPAGVCVYQYEQDQTFKRPANMTEVQRNRLHMLKTRGIVQALVDADVGVVAVSNYLEMLPASWHLQLDAANGNEGTFIALEALAAGQHRMWVKIVNVSY
jgi:hypothetical protein